MNIRDVFYHLSLSFNFGGWKLLLVIKKSALWENTETYLSSNTSQIKLDPEKKRKEKSMSPHGV